MSDAKKPTEEKMDYRLSVAIASVAAIGGGFAVLGAALWNLRVGFSVIVGAAIAVSNLWVLSRIVSALVSTAHRSGAKGWGLLAFFKLLILFGGVWILISRGWVQPIPLMAGFGALPIGIAIGSIVSDRSGRDEDDDDQIESR